jgi:hypothetical protein
MGVLINGSYNFSCTAAYFYNGSIHYALFGWSAHALRKYRAP